MFRKEVVEAIVRNGYSVDIATPRGPDFIEQYFEGLGCVRDFTAVDRHGTNPFRDYELIRQYRSLIRKHHPVAVLTYTIKPNIYGGIAARLCRIPQIANITGLGTSIENSGILSKFAILMYRMGLHKAKTVFCQNSSILAFCQKHRIGHNIKQLPGSGVNLQWHTFQPYPTENEPLRFNLIGRMMKDKGFDEFLTMAVNIHARYPQVEFHLLGGCEENCNAVLKAYQEQGVLQWHGNVPDVRPYIGNSSCTIHPSYHEGMANALLETCAAGRPVIASNINGCKEAVDDGVNGYLVNPRDAEDLTAKVDKFINLPYEQKIAMGKSARRKMECEFDRQIVIGAYLNAIDEAVNGSISSMDEVRTINTEL